MGINKGTIALIFHPQDLNIDLVIYTISGQFNNPV